MKFAGKMFNSKSLTILLNGQVSYLGTKQINQEVDIIGGNWKFGDIWQKHENST